MTRTHNTSVWLLGALLAVDSGQAEASPFDVMSAETLGDGAWDVGIFAPLRHGLSEDLEISSHPITAFWNGNFALKKGWGELGGWGVSTRHGFSYPTRLLAAFARDGAGGILPPDAKIMRRPSGDHDGDVSSTRLAVSFRTSVPSQFMR